MKGQIRYFIESENNVKNSKKAERSMIFSLR